MSSQKKEGSEFSVETDQLEDDDDKQKDETKVTAVQKTEPAKPQPNAEKTAPQGKTDKKEDKKEIKNEVANKVDAELQKKQAEKKAQEEKK